ncbi:MAG TPA: bifunctional diguanylate cyclase/phosphodiesterase [Asanoa sp.]
MSLVISAVFVTQLGLRPPSLVNLAALTLLVGLSNQLQLRFRIGAVRQGLSWADAAVLLTIAIVPAPWGIFCTAVGAAAFKLAQRSDPVKVAFGVSKDTLNATAGTLVLLSLGVAGPVQSPLKSLGALALAQLTVAIVDEVVAIPVISRATGTRIRNHLLTHWDLRATSLVSGFVVAVAVLVLLDLNRVLLVAIPPLVLSLQLWSSGRLRSRNDREAWQRLAAATDALNDVDLDRVVDRAAASAAGLFQANGAEVELDGEDGSARLVRHTDGAKVHDGPAATVSSFPGDHIAVSLDDHEGMAHVGTLRLLFRGPVRLSELETYKLKTFASALTTAVRNASAYAELARLAAQHEHDAAHDALTGLANRRQLMDKGNQQLTKQHAEGVTALLLIDLNHFKEVNDTLGHPAGDRVLIQIADRLRDKTHDTDLVARLGGDEFAVLFTGLPAPAVARHRAENLIRAVHEHLDIDGMRISVEASGGIAAAPNAGGMSELLRRADVAMYQAKRSGQRVATYTRARDTADVGRLALGGDLSRAMAEHEFTVNFQPIVDLSTGEVIAAEALARWHHPEQGTIDPLRFLETVERSGLLPVFADAVLDQSLIAAGTWREAGFDLPVAVNVSPRSLLDARFPGSVMARLRAHDMPPDRLILELTETLTISQLEVVDQVLGRLRDEGIRLALDDFGTGYSSLSVLSRIPVHELKIDREFVMAMETSAEAAAVIRSTVDLGHSLDLVIVAEGVESEPQRRTLWELGCVAGQGHLFARPMAAARLLAALHRGSGGRPGTLAPPLHDEGAVIRLSPHRRQAAAKPRPDRLPHLHP